MVELLTTSTSLVISTDSGRSRIEMEISDMLLVDSNPRVDILIGIVLFVDKAQGGQ